MPGQTQDLRDAEANDQPDVDLTFNELMDELVNDLSLPELTEDDVTIKRMIPRTRLSGNAIRDALQRKVDNGELKIILKRDPKTGIKVNTYVKI